MNDLTYILDKFEPISLEEMDRVKLQNRTDTKFIFNSNQLSDLLSEIIDSYYILEIDSRRVNNYQTLYYDTVNLDSFIAHHNGKMNRTKYRFREYTDSGVTFLEVKFKNNKERTIKSRLNVGEIETTLSSTSKSFVSENSNENPNNLLPALWNSFTRITLAHKKNTERLTIDYNLSFSLYNSELKKDIPHLVIAEVKQEKASVKSDFIKATKKFHIRQSGMSKYCVGTALLRNDVKSNNLKERILKIKKLEYVR